ncbi:MerR family transcriptional regulator [Fibrobacter sp. UWB16]|nr:MerR family transcriptional regulator [Fibrobacter sp. UWB16]
MQKNKSGMRAYSDMDLQWLTMIECLKDSGLQIKKKLFESPDDFDKVTG